ncbi:hypothetical protein L2E82_52198 [Cichorium intybus]|nr:hypothetical protein L2E82_52198 [Cichorium intybus]
MTETRVSFSPLASRQQSLEKETGINNRDPRRYNLTTTSLQFQDLHLINDKTLAIDLPKFLGSVFLFS